MEPFCQSIGGRLKIIFSRKGFDSKYGGVPSPVLPDGRMASLPIPSSAGRPACEVQAFGTSLGEVVAALTGGRLNAGTSVHLDPDLDLHAASRAFGWCPAFGQVGSAQSHLARQGVGIGDLFLFFGWYRHAEHLADGRWQYVAGAPNFHGLFGWLQVTDILKLDALDQHEIPTWLHSHPHVEFSPRFAGKGNTIYLAQGELALGRRRSEIQAGGMFSRWSPKLRLTANGQSRSVWQVPSWMNPSAGRKPLSHHSAPERWIRQGDDLLLKTVPIGQEFVLDAAEYPESVDWAYNLISEHT